MYPTQITGIGIACVYASDYHDAFRFYHELLELNDVQTMSENSCYFKITEKQGLFLVGGYTALQTNEKNVTTTFALSVVSAHAVFEKLKNAAIQTIQATPMQMSETIYWFQCYDPSGNVIEFIGER